jgi:translocation and assembly module TamB
LLTTRASLSGRIDPPSYAVDISTDELEVELPASQTTANHPLVLSEDIVVVDDRRGGRQAGDVDPYLAQSTGEVERTRLKVQLDLSRKSWLRHPSGDLNFTGSLGIDLLGESVVMSGSVDSIRGDFEFLGRDFKVPDKEAIVRFRGADPPNPALDVEAHHPLDRSIVAEVGQAASGDPRIIVRVTGTAVEPRLDLSSDPGMAETDILFVLMTGRPPSNAGVGQDESVANQAVAAASGIFSGLLQQKLSGTLPVDMLRIETGDQGFQDSRIKVGKYITDDIFVSYAYQFGAGDEDSGYEARIEYHFLPRWMVEAVYGENNTGELNVFWDVY